MRLSQVEEVEARAVLPQDHRQQPKQALLAEPVPTVPLRGEYHQPPFLTIGVQADQMAHLQLAPLVHHI
jgi:hypothetical protein